MDVRNSRGKYDEIRCLVRDYDASMAAELKSRKQRIMRT